MKQILILCLFLLPLSAWATVTVVPAGTNLTTVLNTSGDYELQYGTHTLTVDFKTASNVSITAVEGATLVLPTGIDLEYRDGFLLSGVQIRMADSARIKAVAESGDSHTNGADIIGNTIIATGDAVSGSTAPHLYLGQGFNSYHRNIRIRGNILNRVFILEEVGDSITYEENIFLNMDSLRPLQFWGSNHIVRGNYVSGGILGISVLGRHDIAANRRQCMNNSITSNIVIGTSEEGISMDVIGNVGAQSVVREYDTVGSKPGSPVINLSSANWAAQTNYNGSRYSVIFVSGTLRGQRFLITDHVGAGFTLDMASTDYANVAVGDGVSVQLACYASTIANNITIPALKSHRAHTSGIVLHGTGVGITIANNIAYGINDGEGAGDGALTNFAIRETSLNSIDPASSITGNLRRAPVGGNTISNNRNLGGGIGHDYKNYGSATDYTALPSTYGGNSDLAAAAVGWIGGPSPSTAGGFRLNGSSPLRKAGTNVGALTDYLGRAFFPTPSIGAYQWGADGAKICDCEWR